VTGSSPSDPSSPPAADNASAPRIVSSEELLAGGRELLIQHGAERYRLRLTASNKLILVK
jgi:hemin uptake protein HemP